MRTIEDITAEIAAQANEAYARANSQNWHRLIITSQGDIYWAEEIDQHSMSEEIWRGDDCTLMHFQGQRWNGEDEEAYDMIVASPEVTAELDAEADELHAIASDGVEYRKGKKYYGYSPEKWYRIGDLFTFEEANPDLSGEEYMEQAIEAAEEFWAEK